MKNKIITIVIASILLLSSVEMVMATETAEPVTASLGVCNDPTIGITADPVDFGNLYSGSSVTKQLTTTITETPDTDCGLKDMAVTVTVTPGVWKDAVGTTIPGITTTTDPVYTVVNVGEGLNPNTGVFELTTAVTSVVPPGTYNTLITITATY